MAVAVVLCGTVAAAAPPAAEIGSRTALAIHWNDELKTQGGALRNEFTRRLSLSSAAMYDYLLGRKEEFVRYQEKSEAEAEATADPVSRIRQLRNVAHYWSIVEPDRARRLLVRIEREIEALPADKRGSAKHDLAYVFFELADYDKAIACAEEQVSEVGAVNSTSTMFTYGRMARYCLEHRQTELLEKLRGKIRKFEPDPADVDPESKIAIDTEQRRVEALAAAGLPAEAAALYESCWSTGMSYYKGPSGLSEIARSYARAGNRDAAKAFLRKQLAHIEPDRKFRAATAAAHAGDFALVDELLTDAAPKVFLEEFRSAIIAAHLRGDVKQRDELFDRYRDAASRAPKGESVDSDWYLACSTLMLEATMGRYDPALAMLPKLEGEQACELRHLLIDLILHEQGKTFGRLGSSYTLILLGDY